MSNRTLDESRRGGSVQFANLQLETLIAYKGITI
jgi:hypothetical protein